MKLKLLRPLVLLISISAASCLVWNASRDEESKRSQGKTVVETTDMQFSTKSAPMVSPSDVKKLDGKGANDFNTPIDGIPQSPKSRDLMTSSKSIDAILKPSDLEGLREGHKAKQRIDLIPSTKNPNRLVKPKDLEKMIEDKNQKSNIIEGILPEIDPFSPTEKKAK